VIEFDERLGRAARQRVEGERLEIEVVASLLLTSYWSRNRRFAWLQRISP
jgi:hypothetical protein